MMAYVKSSLNLKQSYIYLENKSKMSSDSLYINQTTLASCDIIEKFLHDFCAFSIKEYRSEW